MNTAITRDLPVRSDAGTTVLPGPSNPMDGTEGMAVLFARSIPQAEAFLGPVAESAVAGDSPLIDYRLHG